ncbi:basement membrane-specific heparan sulfate proteoglycan core protein [Perca flavescens]|uniref:basement membrane-specific heparan sulfate proteoglycan core protein n=1 Tax=Perca flavescens TaxID=8167 RepID=UPI00106E28DE|nr:basement membrane-specific heparan sulfate proteoglycan core protein-like [Perca flavescens]
MTQLSSTASTCAAQWKMWLVKVFSVICFTAVYAAQGLQDDTRRPTLKLLSPWQDFFEKESVEFSCEDDSYDWKFTWYRNEKKIEADMDQNLEEDQSYLNISSVTRSYQGVYACQALPMNNTGNSTGLSNKVNVTVYDKTPKPTVSKVPDFNLMYVGETVNFTCKVDVSSGWKYQWYKDGNELPDTSETISIHLGLSGKAEYWCKATRGETTSTDISEKIQQDVLEIPVPSLKLVTPWLDVFPTERVKLSCGMDGTSKWNYTWYKDGLEVRADDVVSFDSNGATLSISSASAAHAGQYICKGHLKDRSVNRNSSSGLTLKVYDKKPTVILTQDPEYKVMFPGESVSFSCHLNVSTGWEYLWYKDSDPLTVSGNQYPISSVGITTKGSYTCRAKRGSDQEFLTDSSQAVHLEVEGNKPKPSMTQQPDVNKVYTGESVSFECKVEISSGWVYHWYKDGTSLPINNNSFNIHDATLSNNGTYECMAIRDKTTYSTEHSDSWILRVSGSRVQGDVPGESVSFSCHLNVSTGWEYLWYKDSDPLTVSGNQYPISSVGITTRGSYTCRAKRGSDQEFLTDSSQAVHLEVEGNKPKPSMTQQPDVNKVYTGESVSFECKVEISSGWLYHWYKDGTSLPINNNSFNIHDATLSNNGTYECMAIRDKTTYSTEHSDSWILRVSEIPVPSLKVVTPWLDVFPTESVKLSCVMDGTSDWTYRWFKDRLEVQADDVASFDSIGATLSISSASAAHAGQYICKGHLKDRSVNSSSSSGLTLKVYDKKPTVILTQDPEYKVMFPGESVSFSCHLNVSTGWEYLWYKDSDPLTVSGNQYPISSVGKTNRGSYTCRAKRGSDQEFLTDSSQAVHLEVEERPLADITLLTGWSEVFSTDSLVLRCRVLESQDVWNYTWWKEGQPINVSLSEKYTVTPENNPEQSLYTCQGNRTGRPSYSKTSDSFKTKNLLLKRRVLLSISGFIFFAIIAIFIGCIVLRVFRKPGNGEDKPEETELFLTMAQLKDRDDAPCPLVQYITDAELNASSKQEADENGMISGETTSLPISSQEDQAVTSESHDTTENNGLVSFKQ